MTGACKCNEGYYMTSKGCRTCEYMLPGCTVCNTTTSNTGIPLYSAASMLEGDTTPKYLDCEECVYGRYVTGGGNGNPKRC